MLQLRAFGCQSLAEPQPLLKLAYCEHFVKDHYGRRDFWYLTHYFFYLVQCRQSFSSPGYRSSHRSLPSQSLRGCWWSRRGPDPGWLRAGPAATPEEAALCWESWSRGGGSGWALPVPSSAGGRSALPPCAATAEEGAQFGSRCRSPGCLNKDVVRAYRGKA